MMTLDAAVQGLGVALESAVIADSYLRAGRLKPVFDSRWAVPVQAHFVVYPKRHGSRPEVAQFLHWLMAQSQDIDSGGK
jgi:LysR family glycine cleavage system transcriptional activator